MYARAHSAGGPLARRSRVNAGEAIMMALLFTLVFGFLWWVIYSTVGAAFTYLVILGSVLAVCVISELISAIATPVAARFPVTAIVM